MTAAETDLLVTLLEGSTQAIDTAMQHACLIDSRGPYFVKADIAHRIFQCTRCRRWRDASLRETSGRCYTCEDALEPKPRANDN